MRQLELLSWVVPAFCALGKEFIAKVDDPKRAGFANELYSDLCMIGMTLALSRGEWAFGLEEDVLNKLLSTLEKRLPKSWGALKIISTFIVKDENFPRLHDLASSIKEHDLGGYNVCWRLLGLTEDDCMPYLLILRQRMKIKLFRKEERDNEATRDLFLAPIRYARKHMLDVYCKDHSSSEASELSLWQHPSSGMKELTDRMYKLLEYHWQCNCAQRTLWHDGAREARLSLIRHQQLTLKVSSTGSSTGLSLRPAKYEVLLPVCNDQAGWKATNVAIINKQKAHKQVRQGNDWKVVDKDICNVLKNSKDFTVDFEIDNNGLWHLRPKPSEEDDHHTTMMSLQQMLREGINIATYSPKEKLILCYVLANSLLFLYPGAWLFAEWSSDKIYFTKRPTKLSSKPVALTLPYLSVHVRQTQSAEGREHLQVHVHPNILALGIMFLEIAMGTAFVRSSQIVQKPWERCNEDLRQALDQLKVLKSQSKKDMSKRVSPNFEDVIYACLKLDPPASCASDSLLDEGPIRQYILSCVIRPLASDLVDGYKIPLEDLRNHLETDFKSPELEQSVIRSHEHLAPPTDAFASLVVDPDASHNVSPPSDDVTLFADSERMSPVRGGEKISDAIDWEKNYHNNVIAQIKKLRGARAPVGHRVKIAILDSGIELDPCHPIMMDRSKNTTRVFYQSWIDDHQDWTDDVGHGTHLSTLLWRLAPNASIHIGRVYKRKPKEVKSTKPIIQALRHAVDTWKVNIIVMSFGFTNSNAEVHQEIQRAAQNGVLIFAAASNGGYNDGIAWPAREDNVICVHSADGRGNRSPFTPIAEGNSILMTLGECVSSAWPPKLESSQLGRQRMSGTSCAAPIAAAIAATVLDYAWDFLTDAEWASLCRASSMRRMLEGISRNKGQNGGYCWIRHWELFDLSRTAEGIKDEIRRYAV